MATICPSCSDKVWDDASKYCEKCRDTVCETCGVRGFDEALIYCDDCQVYAIHRYCLKEMPATFDEYVIWLCEDCEPKVANPSKLAKLFSLSDWKSGSGDIKVVQSEKEKKEKKKQKKLKRKRNNITAVLAESELHEDNNCAPPELKERDLDGGSCVAELQGHNNSPIKLNLVSFSENGEDEKPEPIRKSNEGYLGLTCYVPAQPIIDPIWRGNLSISKENFGAIGRLAAHLSNLACPQVREAAKLLPELLCSELIARSQLWPKRFEKCGPSDENIALYFFPDNISCEGSFDYLVDDMICRDLAMRTTVDNAELLIFTSNVLPLPSWRFQTKYYLWGVFRGKQASASADLATCAEDKGLTKDLKWNTNSPNSPLGNCGSYSSC